MPFKAEKNIEIPPESSYKSYVQDGLSNRRIINRNILLINDSNGDKILTENAPVSVDQDNNVFFRDLIIYLKEQNLIQLGSSLFIYDEERKLFVHQGSEPVQTNILIPLSKFNEDQMIIKYRPIQQPYHCYNYSYEENSNYLNYMKSQSQYQVYPHNIAQNNVSRDNTIYDNNRKQQNHSMNKQRENNDGFQNMNQFSCSQLQNQFNSLPQQSSLSQNFPMTKLEDKIDQENEDDDDMNNNEDESKFDVSTKVIPREKRVKERKIGYVYERVMKWRQYYESGIYNEQGRLVKVNLDMAASLVGLSRKTLDDYYKYIRKAQQYHFDFEDRSDEKIGSLRNFVRDRQKRSLIKQQQNEGQDECQVKVETKSENNKSNESPIQSALSSAESSSSKNKFNINEIKSSSQQKEYNNNNEDEEEIENSSNTSRQNYIASNALIPCYSSIEEEESCLSPPNNLKYLTTTGRDKRISSPNSNSTTGNKNKGNNNNISSTPNKKNNNNYLSFNSSISTSQFLQNNI